MSTPPVPPDAERIAKYLARAGLCSRRDAERLIAEGKVSVDGTRLDSPAVKVTGQERIVVDGKLVASPERAKMWRFYKPTGLVVSHKDEQGRPTVFDFLRQAGLPRVVSVGRLDLNSEGLLLLTNDGALARQLELPANGWLRRYKVRVAGRIDPARLTALAKGVTIDGQRYGRIDAELDRTGGINSWLYVALTEGKNREIRKVMEHLGLSVNRLIRVSYGPFDMGRLTPGEIMPVAKLTVDLLLAGKPITPTTAAPPAPRRAAPVDVATAPPAEARAKAPAKREPAAANAGAKRPTPGRRPAAAPAPRGGKPVADRRRR